MAPLSLSTSATRLIFLALGLWLSGGATLPTPSCVECPVGVKGSRGVGDRGCCDGEQALGVEVTPP